MQILDFMYYQFPPADNTTKEHSRTKRRCAEAFEVSIGQMYKWMYEKREVQELANGDWVLINRHTKICKMEDLGR